MRVVIVENSHAAAAEQRPLPEQILRKIRVFVGADVVGRQVREHPHRKFDLRRAVKFQPEARNLHDAGVAAVVGHAAQKQLQIAAFRRCMVQIMPVPGPADAVGAHQPRRPSACKTAASRWAVVVLPFVPVTPIIVMARAGSP